MTNKNLNRQDTESSHNGTAELKSDGDNKYLCKLLKVNTIFQVLDIMSACSKTQLSPQQKPRNRFHIGIDAVYMYNEENLSKDSPFRIKIKSINPPPHHHHHSHHEVCTVRSLKTAPLNYKNVLVSPASPGLLEVTSPPQVLTEFQYLSSHSKQFSGSCWYPYISSLIFDIWYIIYVDCNWIDTWSQ